MDSVEQITQRTYRYWYEDGIAEIASGGCLVLVGVVFLAQAYALPGPFALLSALGLPLLVVASMLGSRRAVQNLKARVTYPRTGYVAYRRLPGRRRWYAGALGGVMAVLSIVVAKNVPGYVDFLPLIIGFCIGLGFAMPAGRFGLTRFYLLAAASVLLGLFASLSAWGSDRAGAFYFCSIGILVAGSGVLTLRSYLRSTEPPTEA